MRKETPIYQEDELLGWWIEVPEQWATITTIDGEQRSFKTQEASKFFVPHNEGKMHDLKQE